MNFGTYLHSANFFPADTVITGISDTLYIRYRIHSPDPSRILNYMRGRMYWQKPSGNRQFPAGDPALPAPSEYVDGNVLLVYPIPDTGFHEIKFPLSELKSDFETKLWQANDTLLNIRLDFEGDTTLGMFVTNMNQLSPTLRRAPGFQYVRVQGTSESGPSLTGVIALMLDKYRRNYLAPVGKNIHTHAFWNSTAKALIVHTATDLVNTQPLIGEAANPDIKAHDPTHNAAVLYYPGPDFATGYGLVNAEKAVNYTDTNLFKQDSVDQAQEIVYTCSVPSATAFRVTLAWDDPPGNVSSPAQTPKLINDLDLVLQDPAGGLHYPWVLDPLPQTIGPDGNVVFDSLGRDPIDSADIKPARKDPAGNHRDNLEVVDVSADSSMAGTWRILVKGSNVCLGPQDFSLVSDYSLSRTKDTVLADSIAFHIKPPTPSTEIVARDSDTTIYFGGGQYPDTLYAYSAGSGNLKWLFASQNEAFSAPVLAGNTIYVRTEDSLFALQDQGNTAYRLWTVPFSLPVPDTTGIAVGDTFEVIKPAGEAITPAVDPVSGLIYVTSSFEVSLWVHDSTSNDFISAKSGLNMFIAYDAATGAMRFSDTLKNYVQAPPAASPLGGFVVDVDGNCYRITAGGIAWMSNPFQYDTLRADSSGRDTLSYLHGNVTHRPILAPNNYVYVQGDTVAAAVNAQTGQRQTDFGVGKIQGNMIVDANGNLAWVSYWYGQTYLVSALYSGYPFAFTPLGSEQDGLVPTGDLALGDDGLVYVMAANQLLGIDLLSGDLQFETECCSSNGSPVIFNHLLIQASSDGGLFGIRTPTLNLGLGWARAGKDNGGTGYQDIATPGLTPGTLGNGSAITQSSWDADHEDYTLCGGAAGLGGTSDTAIFSPAFLSGDFSLSTKINTLYATDPSAKAGLMVRLDTNVVPPSGPNANSVNGFVWVASSNYAGFSQRLTPGGQTTVHAALGNYVAGSSWVKVRRQGGVLSAYVSQDGLYFTKIGEMNIGTTPIFVGPAYVSGSNALTGCSEFASLEFGSSQPGALFVVGKASPLSPADSTVKTRLQSLGYAVTVKDSLSSCLDGYSLFSQDQTVMGDRDSLYSGKSGSNGYSELGIDAKSFGDVASYGDILLKDRSTVYGNVTSGGSVTLLSGADVTGVTQNHAAVSTCTLPQEIFSVGSQDITVNNGSTTDLLPGDYKDVHVYGNGRLKLRTGTYHFNSLTTEADGQFELNPSSGNIEVFTSQSLAFGDRTQFNFTGAVSPEKIKFHSQQSASLTVGTDMQFEGTLVAPLAEVHVFSRTTFFGSVYAKSLQFEPDVRIHYAPYPSLPSTADADQMDVVVISSTISSANVGARFTSVAVPVLTWEPALMDDLGMAGAQWGVDQGTVPGQTKLNILNPAHPMAAGLSSGVHTILASSDTLIFAVPNSHAQKVATVWNDTSKSVIFGYEQGAALNGLRSPARRTGFFLFDGTATKLNAAGLSLFDAAVKWTAGPVTPSALFVVGNTTLSPGDQAIKDHLEANGYAVIVKKDDQSNTSDANGKNAIVISSSVNSNSVGTKFRDAPVPALNFEPALFDELGMTGSNWDSDQGESGGQTQLKILQPSHVLAGRMIGTLTVTTASSDFTWGRPNGNAAKVGSLSSDTSKYTIFWL